MSDFFNWGDEITNDGDAFVTLMPGVYPATVTGIEKKRWDKQGKMNGCPYAVISMKVGYPDDSQATITDNLFLSRSVEWKIGQFLLACGLKNKGEPIKAERIPSAKGKEIAVTVKCQGGKDDEYKTIKDEEVASWMAKGKTIYNTITKYADISELPEREEEDLSAAFDEAQEASGSDASFGFSF